LTTSNYRQITSGSGVAYGIIVLLVHYSIDNFLSFA